MTRYLAGLAITCVLCGATWAGGNGPSPQGNRPSPGSHDVNPRDRGMALFWPYPNAWLVYGLARLGAWDLALKGASYLVSLHDNKTGGFSKAATSTRSICASRAISSPCAVGTTPSCSPVSPMRRIGLMRICSLTR